MVADPQGTNNAARAALVKATGDVIVRRKLGQNFHQKDGKIMVWSIHLFDFLLANAWSVTVQNTRGEGVTRRTSLNRNGFRLGW